MNFLITARYKLFEWCSYAFTHLACVCLVAVCLVTATRITGYNEYNTSHPVVKTGCTCDCWDGFYRGRHARSSHGTEYKPFYFNYDMYFIPILFVFILYMDLLRIYLRTFLRSLSQPLSIRWFALINSVFAVASNYFGAWSIINYLNDRDGRMLNSQLFFSISELVIGVIYYKNINKYVIDDKNSKINKPVSLVSLYIILAVSVLHIAIGLSERIMWGIMSLFISSATTAPLLDNLARDIYLMGGDLLGIAFFVYKRFISRDTYGEVKTSFQESNYVKSLIAIDLLLLVFYQLFCKFE